MPSVNDTIHILIYPRTPNDAEHILTQLRDTGHITRAQIAHSYDDFAEKMHEDIWETILIDPDNKDLDYRALIKLLDTNNICSPVILTPKKYQEELHEEALVLGAKDLVSNKSLSLLAQAIHKNVAYFKTIRQLEVTEKKLKEAESRCSYLLESSSTPTAYIQEGIHVYANQAYLSLFGYEDFSSLIGTTILDLVAGESQANVKKELKKMAAGHEIADIQFVTEESQPFSGTLISQTIEYEGDSCLQVRIKPAQMDSSAPVTEEVTSTEDKPEDQSTPESQEITLEELAPTLELIEPDVEPLAMASSESSLAIETIELEQNAADQKTTEQDTAYTLSDKKEFTRALMEAIDGADFQSVFCSLFMIQLDIHTSDQAKEQAARQEVIKQLSLAADKFDITGQLSENCLGWITPGGDQEESQDMANALAASLAQVADDEIKLVIQIALIKDSSKSAQELLTDSAKKIQETLSSSVNNLNVTWLNSNESLLLDGKISDVLKNNDFQLFYQPVISLRGEEVEHYEVITQFPGDMEEEHPLFELLYSDKLSENLKRRIERWQILHAVKALSKHLKNGHNSRIFVNLTSASAKDESLPSWVQAALSSASLSPDSIIFQFSTQDIENNLPAIKRFTLQLRSLGIRTSAMEFEANQLNSNLLEKVTIDYVKIASRFSEMIDDTEKAKELKELLSKIKEAGNLSIVPGVDSAAIVSKIWNYDIQFIQGNYIKNPSSQMDYDFS